MLSEFIKKNFLLKCLGYVFVSFRSTVRRWLGNIQTHSGTTHENLNLADSLSYIQGVFEDYKTYGKVTKFHGRVAEIGPGDNVGVALLMLQEGTERIDLADKFFSQRHPEHQKKIYEALLEKYPSLKPHFKGVDLRDDAHFPGIHRYYGDSAAGETFFKDQNTYDFIVSRSVFEHLDDPLLTLDKMIKALKPGGKLIHKVDLRDHGMFSKYFHELKFYEVPDLWYRLMTWKAGYPNRFTFDQYKNFLTSYSGITATFYIAQLTDVGPLEPCLKGEQIPPEKISQARNYVEKYKEFFSSSLRRRASEDLAVASFFMVVEKGA